MDYSSLLGTLCSFDFQDNTISCFLLSFLAINFIFIWFWSICTASKVVDWRLNIFSTYIHFLGRLVLYFDEYQISISSANCTLNHRWSSELLIFSLKHSSPTVFLKAAPGSSTFQISSIQFGHSVMSDSLWPHGLQHARLPYPSPTPGACSNSCSLSKWCHLTISSSVVPFSYCLQSFPASGSFPMSQSLRIRWPKYWSFSFSISPSNEHSGLISFRIDCGSPCCPRDSQESSPTPQFKIINSLALSFVYSPTLTSIYDYWENHSVH